MNMVIEAINLAKEAVSTSSNEVTEQAASVADNVKEALMMSGAGMIGIFIVIGVIIISVSILNKVGNKKEK